MLPIQCRRRHKSDMAYLTALIGILLLFPAATSQAQILKQQTHFLGPFNQSNEPLFALISTASIHFGALQVTPDSAGSSSVVSMFNNSGRVFLKTPFKLWDGSGGDTAGKLVSFNTSFLINVFRYNNGTPGEGLAFVIAPSLSIPLNSSGGYLGLTNATTDGNVTNRFVAVELDTVKQNYDPNNNHIGLNINSVISNVTVPLRSEIAPIGTQFYVLWIEYYGDRKLFNVYMAPQPSKDLPIVKKPAEPVISSSLDLRKIVNQNSYFGFSASTGNTVELNCVLKWNITIEVFDEKGKTGKALAIGLGVGIPLLIILIGGFGWYYHLIKKKKSEDYGSNSQIMGTLKSLPGTPREFNYQELKKATNNFDEKFKLGEGGYGVVYRGILPKEKLQVAVKKFSRDKMKSTDDFLAELTIINRLRHKHLVKLQGWCHKNGVLLLVYDYMPNGSLDDHIFCEEGTSRTPLSWPLRYKILSGVASALNYLHNEYDQTVVHRDLKASNIMLDSDFNARLGDFGLARALENEKTSYAELEGVQGTMGYIAPECFHTGKATRESDVYGFGAVLLETVCGQRPWTKIEGYQFLVDWVWYLHREGRILEAVDKSVGNEYDVEEVERILKLGLICSHPVAGERPNLQTIVQILSGSVNVPYVPPFKPSFMWPAVDLASLASTDFTGGTTTSEYTPMTSNNTQSLRVEFSDNGSMV
ncbi:unnamed protein product [Trifolium pratense]|uniref:Uncharacterized protein n=1 Tax=Trifolium pratense TaxID=57577 RepID=A0ACB0JP80_TRIPR|nr:unnamed protein product [Trifolium pratense]